MITPSAIQIARLEKAGVPGSSAILPQLFRFCFLMTGDPAKAQEAFGGTLREAALRAARGAPDGTRLWLFREARRRALEVTENDLKPEPSTLEEQPLAPDAAEQIRRLEPTQLATWIAAAPEPQRSALALYYLDEFSYQELLALLGMKLPELGAHLALGRRQFQAWTINTALAAEE